MKRAIAGGVFVLAVVLLSQTTRDVELRVRILDGDGDRPTPVRVHLEDANGTRPRARP